MNIVITGSNRGIGLEFVRQYLERGDHVYAGVRQPDKADALMELAKQYGERLKIGACDIRSDASVKAFAESLGDVGIDMLINNAAVSGQIDGFFTTDLDDALTTYDTNTLGTIRVTRALMPHLRRSSLKKIVNISTNVASIGDTTSEIFLGYRMSKVAINMVTKVLAQVLAEEGFTVMAVHPGWVSTDMGGPMAPTTPEQSVRGMIAQIDLRGTGDSGTFFDFKGGPRMW